MTDYYSSIAAGYDELHGVEQEGKLKEFLSRVHIPMHANLLDVGCGTGRSHLLLPQVRWQGIDPSHGLIEQAHPDVKRKIACCAGEQLPFPKNTFDYVLSLTALQNYDDPIAGVREMQRVARPQAIFMVSFLKKSEKSNKLQLLLREEFTVQEEWENSKDFMFICKKKHISM